MLVIYNDHLKSNLYILIPRPQVRLWERAVLVPVLDCDMSFPLWVLFLSKPFITIPLPFEPGLGISSGGQEAETQYLPSFPKKLKSLCLQFGYFH